MPPLRRRVWAHAPFAVLAAAGITLRILVSLAYRPALLLQRDSYAYVNQALGGAPSGGFRPPLYATLLKPLLIGHNLLVVPILQHVAALGLALLLYLLLRRRGLGAVGAALGTAPLLLDPYQVDLEQYVLTETLFELLMVGALVLLVWWTRPPLAAVIASGVLLGAAGLTRYAGLALVIPVLAFMIVARLGWVRTACVIGAFVLPLAAYPLLTARGPEASPAGRLGPFLFGRVLPFADCPTFHTLRAVRALLCGTRPGPRDQGYFAIRSLGGLTERRDGDRVLLHAAVGTIEHQPVDYMASVGSDFGRYFDLTGPQQEESYATRWRFITTVAQAHPVRFVASRRGDPPRHLGFSQRFDIDVGIAAVLWAYQRHLYTWGPLLGLLIALGIAGGAAALGRPGGPAGVAGLFGWSAAVLLLFSVAVTVYHVRYGIPALPLAGPAGAAGAAALGRRLGLRGPELLHQAPGRGALAAAEPHEEV